MVKWTKTGEYGKMKTIAEVSAHSLVISDLDSINVKN
jgi:hypothetical protein